MVQMKLIIEVGGRRGYSNFKLSHFMQSCHFVRSPFPQFLKGFTETLHFGDIQDLRKTVLGK